MTTTTTREKWLEVLVVCCIGVFPDVFNSQLFLLKESPPVETFEQGLCFLVLRALWVSIPVLWIMRRSGEPWGTFGLVRPRLGDLPLGLLAFALYFGACYLAWWPLVQDLAMETSAKSTQSAITEPKSALHHALLPVMAIANGFAEELVVRAYLITRLRELTGPVRALLVSTALFTAYHTYMGTCGALQLAAGGLTIGAMFLATRRLWPVALAHAGLDYLGYAWGSV